MKNLISPLLIGIILLFSFISKAEVPDSIDKLYQYLGSTVRYPEKARANNHQGNAIILFNVGGGKLSTLKIEAELGEGCDVEILNALLSYPDLKNIPDGKYALTTSFRIKGSTTPVKNENNLAPTGYTQLKFTVMADAPRQTAVSLGLGNSTKAILVNNNGSIRFRGSSTDPKVFVDSVEIEYGQLQTILPERIESIHIYRGVDAAANYGPEAVNGVIAIITKKQTLKINGESSSQTSKANNDTIQQEEKVYNFVSMKNPPKYPGGMVKFYQFLRTNIKNPSADVQGNVFVSFIVEKDGTLSNISVLRGLGKEQNEEAIRVFKLSKKWEPGLEDGQPVKVKYNLPVKFN